MSIVVPARVNVEATRYAHDCNVLAGGSVFDDLEEWYEAGSNLVPARVHYKLFDIRPSNSADLSVVVDPQEHHSALEIRECHELFCQLMILNGVALEFNARIFTVTDNFKKLSARDGHLESV